MCMNLLLAQTSSGIDWAAWGANIGYAVLAALGVGAVIFIHELGHFAVAKWCGVKCEKFYIGFGKPLVKFQWGETEYGIGMIPLGGYVKMLGQDDNPSSAAAEIERARLDQGGGAELPTYDPRSYMAKTVPQRMAIISAGVIMNLIFAVVVASVAYGIGVEDSPCKVGGTVPGGGAWKANLLPGDTIVAINGEPVKRFDDLKSKIALGEHDGGARIHFIRAGEKDVREAIVQPNTKDIMPMIGVMMAFENQLHEKEPFVPGSPAANATPPFEKGDKIVRIGDTQINSYADVQRILADEASKSLQVTVQRKKAVSETVEEITTSVDPAPLRTLGVQMRLGPVRAVQDDSPAAEVDVVTKAPAGDQHVGAAISARGLRAGDLIVSVNGLDNIDPMKLPEMMRQLAGMPVMLKVQRDGEKLDVEITPRAHTAFEGAQSFSEKGISVPALGIVCEVVNNIQAIEPDSSAAKAGLKLNDKIEWVEAVPADEDAEESNRPAATNQDEEYEPSVAAQRLKKAHRFGEGIEELDWPLLMTFVQDLRDGEKLRIKVANREPVVIEPYISTDEFYPERGFVFTSEKFTIQATSFQEALGFGLTETWKQSTRVYSFIKGLIYQRVSVKGAGGPITIAQGAFYLAGKGWSPFLIFLVALSANLAVINFLPIPVLDGGHFVFLTLEGLRGKPVSEKVFIGFTYAGLAFLLMVMGFVLWLDVSRMVS
ncbi:MAG: RIP metalloprotease RseP [Planctomycetia bacterium]|nr:RIP metalloprotease RseP [Planctomycetia bacterium]